MRRTFLIAVFAALMPIAAFAAPVFSISGGTGAFGAGSESGYMYTFNVAGGFGANDTLNSETIIVAADVGPGLKIDSVLIHLDGEYSGFPLSNVFANFMTTGDISASDAVATPGFMGSLPAVAIGQQPWTLNGTDNTVGVQSISFNLKHAVGGRDAEITTNTVKISLGVSVIPEPSSALAIMALGLAGTAVRRRRV